MGARVKIDEKSRTIAYLESHGWLAEDVERKEGPITRDCFGAWDVLGIGPKGEVMLVQCTDVTHVAARVRKCSALPTTALLLSRRVRCEVWGWSWEESIPRVVQLSVRVTDPPAPLVSVVEARPWPPKR